MDNQYENAEDILLDFKDIVHGFNDKLCALSGGCQFIQKTNNLTDEQKKMFKLAVQACQEFSDKSSFFVERAARCLKRSEIKKSSDNIF
jgi:hypothetical protein